MDCACGCGEETRLARQTDTRFGYVRGEPMRFVRGHNARKPGGIVIEDRGYLSPCWIWTGPTANGYGWDRGEYAHRRAYEETNGPLPAGLEPDHLCFQTLCRNPDHLEAVTRGENLRRAWAAGHRVPAGAAMKGSKHARKARTHCGKGHALVEVISGGQIRRRCRECEAADARLRRHTRPASSAGRR